MKIRITEACQYISLTDTCCFSGSTKRTEGEFVAGHEMEVDSLTRDQPQRGVSTAWRSNGSPHPDRWLIPSRAVEEVRDFAGNGSERM